MVIYRVKWLQETSGFLIWLQCQWMWVTLWFSDCQQVAPHTKARLWRQRRLARSVPVGWRQPPTWIPAWWCPRVRASKSELACSGLGPKGLAKIRSPWSRVSEPGTPNVSAQLPRTIVTSLEEAEGSGNRFWGFVGNDMEVTCPEAWGNLWFPDQQSRGLEVTRPSRIWPLVLWKSAKRQPGISGLSWTWAE